MTPRAVVNEDHVFDLVDAALAGMNAAMDNTYTSSELFSAVLSLTGRVIYVLIAAGADEADIRKAVELLFPQPKASKTFDPRMN